MKNKNLITVLLITAPFMLRAQFSISGKVKNKDSKEAIVGANIGIRNTFIASTSDEEGKFEIKNLKKGTYIVNAYFIGFQNYSDTILLAENKIVNIELSENTILMDEVIVIATRAGEKSAMAFTNINKQQIAEQNLGQDLPYLLNQQPSVVTTSDAGAGVGYTGMRIRGVDATRINVTLNGIPVNDPESQGTWWVNLPDISSSIDNIQIQRGVGKSTNGAGAFGASINIQTSKLNSKGYGEYNASFGSFNTFKNTVNAGSGLIDNKFAVDMRLSNISSNGFIDKAASDLKSYYLSGAYYGKKTIIKFITFSGLEETYQAWNGIPESRLKGDIQGMNDYIQRNGLGAVDAAHLLNSNSRTYNEFTYKTQIDKYKQTYYQLHFSHQFNRNWNANIALHYTKGKGYYEEYKKKQRFSDYGLQDLTIGIDTITETDIVRRRWLDNDFYGTTYSLNYNSFKKFSATLGGGYNKYDGLHYGEIIWAKYASNSILHQNYYGNSATKTDGTIFINANYLIVKKINLFADIQYRAVNYSFLGYDNNLNAIQQTALLLFINPKIGVNYDFKTNANVYASYSIGNKEPSRNDYTESTPKSRPKFETLNDLEIGYKQRSKIARWGVNLYNMRYKNQLVLTGEVNDVGGYNRTNVEISYRTGIEVEFGIKILKSLSFETNATFSKNNIINFQEFIDNYDSTAQRMNTYKETDIAFSPNVIGGSTLTFEPVKNLKFNFICKYVGEQFLDNTSNKYRKLNPFLVNDFRINYSFKTKNIREIGFIIAINNLFSTQYAPNGYTYGYISGGQHTVENFYYPQAGINFMAGLSFKL
jgi:iron complex outermembrane receptor protein